jgi:hypothetical protein
MTLDDFYALCDRAWSDAESRGDVIELRLVPASRSELCVEVLTTGPSLASMRNLINDDALDGIAASSLVTDVVNPVTRSAVKITGSSDGTDRALVSYGSRREPELLAV